MKGVSLVVYLIKENQSILFEILTAHAALLPDDDEFPYRVKVVDCVISCATACNREKLLPSKSPERDFMKPFSDIHTKLNTATNEEWEANHTFSFLFCGQLDTD